MNKSFNNRVSFISWLSSNCPNNISPQDILKSLDEGSERSLRLRYSDKSFWEMSSVEEYTRTTEKLLSSLKWSKLLFLRKKASALLEKSIELYKHFLSEKNTVKNCYVDSSKRVVEGERSFPTIDRTEAIYLIDKYLDTIAHKGDWVSIANDTSRLFRNRALKFDMAIDEEFRNVPFVEECFSDIAKLFQNSDNEKSHPLLRELVNLYLKDPNRYSIQSTIVHEELVKMGVLFSGADDVTTCIQGDNEGQSEHESDNKVTDNIESEAVFQEEEPCTTSYDNVEQMQHIMVPTPSMDDRFYLSDRLYLILKTESVRNPNGLTLYYISSRAKAPQEVVKAILGRSEWALYQNGKYCFVSHGTDKEEQYSFAHSQSLAYTKPTKLLYFGEVVSEATTWRQLYFDFMKTIYEDYPDIIRNLLGKSYPRFSSPLVGSATELNQFKVPGEFAPGLIIELDRAASNIANCIEKLLELCNVDCENVCLFFKRKQPPVLVQNEKKTIKSCAEFAVSSHLQKDRTTERRYTSDDKEAFYCWLKKDQNLAEATCAEYISAICVAEAYACRNVSSSCILFCDNKSIVEFTAHALFSNDLFKKKNKQAHDRFFIALRKYLEYRHILTSSENETNSGEISADVMGKALEELEFSTRTYNSLKKSGIDTLGELCDIMRVRNLGRSSLGEVLEKIKEYHLTLKYLNDQDDHISPVIRNHYDRYRRRINLLSL